MAKCKEAILNAFEEKTGAVVRGGRRGSKGIFSFPRLPEFLDRMHAELGGDISKILKIEGGEHRPKRRVAGMTMGGLRRKVAIIDYLSFNDVIK